MIFPLGGGNVPGLQRSLATASCEGAWEKRLDRRSESHSKTVELSDKGGAARDGAGSCTVGAKAMGRLAAVLDLRCRKNRQYPLRLVLCLALPAMVAGPDGLIAIFRSGHSGCRWTACCDRHRAMCVAPLANC